MRFQFCGDLDCPDWVLAEIYTLSKMSSIKMKILCQVVAKSLSGHDFDKEKAKKLILDAKLDDGDMKASVAALSFVLSSSVRYGVEEDALNNELQQLGLPKEHATALCKVYNENVSAMTERARAESLRTSTLVDCGSNVGEGGKIELDLEIRDHIKEQNLSHVVTMSAEQLALLLSDLKSAREETKRLPCFE